MKSLFSKGGLSTRWKATPPLSVTIFKPVTFVIAITVLALLVTSCNRTTNGQRAEQKKTQADSLSKPKVDIKVNRQYDEKGNMIGFDSTYTSYYSNMSGDTVQMDSLMGSFDRYFRKDHSSFLNKQFDPLFFNDSARYPDFFHNDFFMKRYELNNAYFRGMMHDMDSIKNNFYKEHRKVPKKEKA